MKIIGYITPAAIAVSFAFPLTFAQAQEGVTALCLYHRDAPVCACATDALAEELSNEDFALYDAIGADTMSRHEAGTAYVEAWEAASAAAAERLGISIGELRRRTNEVGRSHNAAIKACAG